MKRIAILGLGLMGGSLGLALKHRQGADIRIAGYARRPETQKLALKLKAIDEAFDDPAKAVQGADVVVLCVPVLAIPDLLRRCSDSLKTGCIVTDVGSTKAELVGRMEPIVRETKAVFLGSHPLTGSEQQGLDAARADLYEGALVVMTPSDGKNGAAVECLGKFWEMVGASVKVVAPEEHDRIVARTSHLPHMVAALVAATVGRDGDLRQIGAYCGPGFRDTTRIAEGSAEVWHDIIQSNRQCLAGELAKFKVELDRVSSMVEEGDSKRLLRFLEEGRSKRRQLMQDRRVDDPRGNL